MKTIPEIYYVFACIVILILTPFFVRAHLRNRADAKFSNSLNSARKTAENLFREIIEPIKILIDTRKVNTKITYSGFAVGIEIERKEAVGLLVSHVTFFMEGDEIVEHPSGVVHTPDEFRNLLRQLFQIDLPCQNR